MVSSSVTRMLLALALVALQANATSSEAANPVPAPAKSEAIGIEQQVEAALTNILVRSQELQAQLDKLTKERAALEQEAARLVELRKSAQTGPAQPSAPGSLVASNLPATAPALILPVVRPANEKKTADRPASASTLEAPLSFRIGAADFTPGGFMDFTTAFRSTNLGSGAATSFGAVPFSNTAAGQLSETRLGGQASRISLKVTSHPGNFAVTGYVEADFLGAVPSNAFVTSNSYALRMRLFYGDVQRGKWELAAGQAWSLLTPNRVGLSVAPGDVGLPMTADPNYQLGLVWARDPQARIIYHANEHWALGASLENSNQFVGSGVVLPASLPATEVDNGSNLATPALQPDIIAKVAYDTKFSGRAFHVELAGLLSNFKIVNPVSGVRSSKDGGGVSLNLRVEPVRNLRFIANTFLSDGGGRYNAGLGPSLMVRPDLTVSPVRSASLLGGVEYQFSPKWTAYGYYGLVYFDRNVDASGKTIVGFGAPNSGGNANRSIQEPSVGITRTFWKSPAQGALQYNVQYSYLLRMPWWVAAGTPTTAHAHMVLTELRYVLP
jgi:hypothetical protein